MVSSRAARFTTGPKTVTFTWSTVSDFSGHRRSGRQSDADAKTGQWVVVLQGSLGKFGSNAQRGSTRLLDRPRILQRPTPRTPSPHPHESPRRRLPAPGCSGSSLPKAPLTRCRSPQQVPCISLRPSRKPSQVTEQHRHFRLPRSEDVIGILAGQSLEDHGRKE